MGGLQWQHPWWLALAFVPLLLRLLPQRDRRPQLEQFIARHLWPRLLTRLDTLRTRPISPLVIGAWLLACIALAGPELPTAPGDTSSARQANVAIILDISPSMRVADVAPSRLAYSKQLLIELARQLKGQRLALIAFSANAYTVVPLTSDNQIVQQMIEAMDPSLASVTGSNLSRALQLAQEALSLPASGDEPASDGVALLVSDGGIHDQGALAASRQLRQAGHRLYTLGVGSDSGGPVPFATGRLATQGNELVTSRLERQTLRALAQAGGGDYADLRPEAWPQIMGVIEEMKQPQQRDGNVRHGTPLFPLFLFLALAAFIWHGVRHPALAAVVLALPLLMQSPPSEAAAWDEAKGASLLQRQRHQEALELYKRLDDYNGQIGRGVAAYHLGQWQEALDAFSQALTLARGNEARARAAYNRGNALVHLGRLDEASDAYKSALLWQPGHARANRNLTLLQENQPKGGERPGKSDYQRQGDGGEEERNRPSSQNSTQTDGRGISDNQPLQQSLKQWGQPRPGEGGVPSRTQQQLNSLKEDYQTMLKHRFATEDDNNTAGLVVEKPW